MCCIIELLYVQSIAFEFDDSTFVVIHIAVVWCGEDSYNNWEFRWPVPLVHLVAVKLGFVGSKY